jgi:sugar O-acyltransferase (sialic acid O-acetyltransferase NeuD family)
VLGEFVAGLGYCVVTVFDNAPGAPSPLPEIPIYYGFEGFTQWNAARRGDTACLVAIGGARGRARLAIQSALESYGIAAATVVHPCAFAAADAGLGKGTQVLVHAALCAGTRVGDGCILNTASRLDHESILGHGVHLGPGATLCGCVSVGDFSFIGAGAVVLPRIRIGKDVIIGAGSVVTRNVPDGVVAFGNPARIVRGNRYDQDKDADAQPLRSVARRKDGG